MEPKNPQSSKLRKTLRWVIGILFLVLGVLGLVLPILQGFLFLMVGALILAPQVPWLHSKIEQLKARHPKFRKIHAKADNYKNRLKAKMLNLKKNKK